MGWTGHSLYGGSYYIKDGMIQSGSPAPNNGVTNRNLDISSGTSADSPFLSMFSGDGLHYGEKAASERERAERGAARMVADVAGTQDSDYGDYIRQLLEISDQNTAKSQAFAREQMEFQRESDQAAMAWSAAEAQKNRDWQERLSNSAHQREVQDLIAAGLNPILSANQGAYTGSGATGQAFSSNGAMGTVDTSGSGLMGSLVSSLINSATQAYVAGLYTDAERYSSDLQYSSSRLATEASILNNHNTNSANRAIAREGFENDLLRTHIQGQYGLQNVGLSGEYNLQNTKLQGENTLANTRLQNEGAQTREIYSQSSQNRRQEKQLASEEARTQAQINANLEEAETRAENGAIVTTGGMKGMANVLLALTDGLLNRKNADYYLQNNRDTNINSIKSKRNMNLRRVYSRSPKWGVG